jgi:hypothetical protein
VDMGLCRPGNESTGEHDNKAAPGQPPFILERRSITLCSFYYSIVCCATEYRTKSYYLPPQ